MTTRVVMMQMDHHPKKLVVSGWRDSCPGEFGFEFEMVGTLVVWNPLLLDPSPGVVWFFDAGANPA